MENKKAGMMVAPKSYKGSRGAEVSSTSKILGLDGIRALAALSVIFTHLSIYQILQDKGLITASIANSINGSAGVQAFFVLSGFLITHLLTAEYKKNGTISLYNFYIRRSLRIFPLYFLIIFMVAIAQYIGETGTNIRSFTFAVFYLYNFIPEIWYSGVLGHTWTLAVEEHFYFIWPFIFISTAPKFMHLNKKLLIFIMLSFFITIILANFEWLNKNFFVERWSFTAGGNIAMGALLATLLAEKEVEVKIKPFLSSFGSLVLGFILIFSEVWLNGTNQFVAQYLRGIGFTIVVGWLVFNQNSKLTRALEIAPLRYLGRISYGIYMYQGFFLSTGPYREPNQTWPPNQSIGLILLILAAPLSYHFFEKPIISLKQKLQRVPADKSGNGSTMDVCHDSDRPE